MIGFVVAHAATGIGTGLVLALIWKIVDFFKQLIAGNRNGAVTQAVVWAVAIAVAFLAANADLTDQLTLVGNIPLGALNFASVILAGLLVGSGASSLVDFKQAFDGSDSAAKPDLTPLAHSKNRAAHTP